MKKHIFAFICIFILMFNTFSYTETKAMDIGVAIDVGSEILYEGWDMIQSIFNGFVISLGQYAGYADKASAMAAFYNDWGDVLTVLTGGYLSPAEVEQSAISVNTVMPRDFGMTGATMRDFIFNYGGFISDPNLGMYADVNMKSLASWNRYNDLYAKVFLDAHNADIDQHPTFPEPQYQSYIDCINGDVVFNNSLPYYPYIGNWTFQSPNYDPQRFYMHGSLANRSFYSNPQVRGFIDNNPDVNVTTIPIAIGTDVITLNVNGNDYDGWHILQTDTNIDNSIFEYIYNSPRTSGIITLSYENHIFSLYSGVYYSSATWLNNVFNSTYGTLSSALTTITQNFRHINLYVNGVLWAYVGEVEEPIVDLGIDHPRYDENGQMIGNDVFFPEQDLKADLVKFTELIDDKILDGDSIGLDDLIDAGILTDAEGNIITDENRDEYITTRDISSVITDALIDTDIADLLPDAPDPPYEDPWNWHFPNIVIPEGGDPDPRDTGLSVLARIVNVTNQSLPGEIITMFWGIVITMLILGIIKILHK